MDSYNWLMGNLQAALRAARPNMKSKIRMGKIKKILYEFVRN